ncbi:MAG: glutamine amidotransferase family protein [Nitrospinota bacterium]
MGFAASKINRYPGKDISGCGLTGFISRKGERVSGEVIARSICNMNDRGNGLGAGFAAYGIYPDYKDLYAFHIMYDNNKALKETEEYIKKHLIVEHQEKMPTRHTKNITSHPIVRRYFARPRPDSEDLELSGIDKVREDDFIVHLVMHINSGIDSAYVFSSGKDMGAFKGVGLPGDIADFFSIEEYSGYLWTAHNRFPTNTPGWWGGAHPFTLLDWSIVHNGEISSYGINMRYLEMFGYKCTLLTDTEVVTYLLDLLIRRHGLSYKVASMVLAAPFWKDIARMNGNEKKMLTALRMVYGGGLLNGPFAIIFAHTRGMVGLNDRIKLRPLIVATKGDFVYMASEESAIREICPVPERVWAPKAGEPVIAELYRENPHTDESA